MSAGPQSTIELLAQRLLYRWVPKWYEAFHDTETHLFHERVGHAFRPVETGRIRLLTQCRQISVYAHAHKLGAFHGDIARHVEALVACFHVADTGGWRFSVDCDLKPHETFYDLYAQGFVIFAMAHVGDEAARQLAINTARFIDKNMRAAQGFHESLDAHMAPRNERRRHESHMHLLEACLFAADRWDEGIFRSLADDIVRLFFSHFYRDGVLSEYFSADLQPVANENGQIVVEPGHYGEWIWLLKKHASLMGEPDRYDQTCRDLLAFANKYGWDDIYNGIYDELNPEGGIVADTKRIWPFCELLKANALMIDAAGVDRNEIKAVIHRMVKVFRASYIQERGFWSEWLARDLTPMTDYMPGTTPYHVYFGIMETRSVLQARGPSRSWRIWAQTQWFRSRRAVSNGVRAVRYRFK
jgi:mannose-6-phosphate isomerase